MINHELTYYELLGVSPTATLREIKDAYREKIWQYHPDVNPNKNKEDCHTMMCLLNEAYETLRNIESRIEYDLSLKQSGQYPSEERTSIEGDVPNSEDNTNHCQRENGNQQPVVYYQVYEYYNEIDYDYYRQQKFVEFVEWIYNYYFKVINTDDVKSSAKEMTIIEKIIELFESIINAEKTNYKKRLKSNRL